MQTFVFHTHTHRGAHQSTVRKLGALQEARAETRATPYKNHLGTSGPNLKTSVLIRVCQTLTNFYAPFFKEIPSFFCGVTPSKTLAAPQPPNIAFPLGNGGVLRSDHGEGFRKEGDGGAEEKRRKKGRAKSAQNKVES